jgi:hypothetical protein
VSYSIDVNVLLYASTDGSPHAAKARAFLAACASTPDAMYLGWTTLFSYLRMATHPAIVSPPLSQRDAEANVAALLSVRHARVITEGEGFWELYQESTKGLSVKGKLVHDAHLATLLRQHGVKTLYTNDRDFMKFEFLDVKNPLS